MPQRVASTAAAELLETITPDAKGDPRFGTTWRTAFPSGAQALVALPFVALMVFGFATSWSDIVPSREQVERNRNAIAAYNRSDYDRVDELVRESVLEDTRDVNALIAAYCARVEQQRLDDAAAAMSMAVDAGASENTFACFDESSAPGIVVPVGRVSSAVIPNTAVSREAYAQLGDMSEFLVYGSGPLPDVPQQPVVTIACDAIDLGYDYVAYRWIQLDAELGFLDEEIPRTVHAQCGDGLIDCDDTGCFITREFAGETNRERIGETGFENE